MKMENTKTIKLINPLKRGTKEFKEVTINKPNVNSLKGLTMLNVLNADVDSIRTLLPRVTNPVLCAADFNTMDITDFTELTTGVIGFFVKSEATETETETEE